MNDAAMPQDKTTGPHLLTIKGCLWRMTYSLPFVLLHLGAALYFHQAWLTVMGFCFGREILSYAFLLFAVRRGKRLIDPWSVELKQRHLCAAERFDAVTGAAVSAATLFYALFLITGGLVGTQTFWTFAAVYAALVVADCLRVRHLCKKAKNSTFEAEALQALAEASVTPTVPVSTETAAQTVRPPVRAHWWTDAGTRDEVQQVGRKEL